MMALGGLDREQMGQACVEDLAERGERLLCLFSRRKVFAGDFGGLLGGFMKAVGSCCVCAGELGRGMVGDAFRRVDRLCGLGLSSSCISAISRRALSWS